MVLPQDGSRAIVLCGRLSRPHLDVARASLHEIEAILELVALLGYLPAEELSAVEARRAHCAKLVYGLLRKMSAAG